MFVTSVNSHRQSDEPGSNKNKNCLYDLSESDLKWAENDQSCQKLLAEVQDRLTSRTVAEKVGAYARFWLGVIMHAWHVVQTYFFLHIST